MLLHSQHSEEESRQRELLDLSCSTGMDPRFCVTREDWYNLQMEVKQIQYVQGNHTDRLVRLEKRQADDASIKSVWNSPFPGVLSGTPQQGESSLLMLPTRSQG
jgi:hypothetical protein